MLCVFVGARSLVVKRKGRRVAEDERERGRACGLWGVSSSCAPSSFVFYQLQAKNFFVRLVLLIAFPPLYVMCVCVFCRCFSLLSAMPSTSTTPLTLWLPLTPTRKVCLLSHSCLVSARP